MSIQINKRVMTYFIAVALLCCVIILFAPSIRFIPAQNVHLRQVALTTTLKPIYESSTTDNNAESKIHEDLEFHAKQGGSVKLDFNRLALEGMNSLGAGKSSSEISDSNPAGPNEGLGAGKSAEISDSHLAGPNEGLGAGKSSEISDSNPAGANEGLGAGKSAEISDSNPAGPNEELVVSDQLAASSQATSISAEEGKIESLGDAKKLNVNDEALSGDSQKAPSQV